MGIEVYCVVVKEVVFSPLTLRSVMVAKGLFILLALRTSEHF